MAEATEVDRERTTRTAVARPGLYVVCLILVIFATFASYIGRNGIFACPAAYGAESLLAYCEGDAYGDYEHGALWYGLEPRTEKAAVDADVIFVGNSRLQFGFSGPAFPRWFEAHDRRGYLLGMGFGQKSAFFGPLIDRIEPQARVYIVNADSFFSDTPEGPAAAVLQGAEARPFLVKKLWQGPHRLLCGLIARLCGGERAFYRNYDDGEWVHLGRPSSLVYPRIDAPANLEEVAEQTPIAERFLAGLPVDRSCVLFTFVWTPENETETARALAEAVDVTFIAPELEGLVSFDTSHLDLPSAERWTTAFFELADPHLRRCLDVDAPPAGALGG